MRAVLPQFVPLLLILSAMAQDTRPAEIRGMRLSPQGESMQLEVTLTKSVQGKITVVQNPPRLVLDLPNTLSPGRQRHVNVGHNGIESVRIALMSSNPPVTRIVLDLDSARPYDLSATNNTLRLILLPGTEVRTAHGGNGAPSAAGVPLFGRLHRKHHSAASGSEPATILVAPAPPAAQAPIQMNDAAAVSADASATNALVNPSAKHPIFGSLQQGTVFPSNGQPGTGVVPSDRGSQDPSAVQTAAPAIAGSARVNGSQNPGMGTNAVVSHATTSTPAVVQPTPIIDPSTFVLSNGSTARIARSLQPQAVPPAVIIKKQTDVTMPTGLAAQTIAAPKTEQPAPAAETAQPTTVDENSKIPELKTRQPNADVRTAYKVKYVAEGAAYLDAGRSSGLSEGMKLEVLETAPGTTQNTDGSASGIKVVAELKVVSVAETSAVTDISEPTRDVKPGDLAYLSSEDTQSLVAQRSLSPTRKFPAVISFTEGDPLDEEAREEVPRPPLPEINRARGRIGFDYSSIISHSPLNSVSSNVGMVIRTDITRIGGSYWNMSGYWRGRFTSNSSSQQPTLQDLMNRTYHLGLTYDNPNSRWVAGVGRLYLPWATSLDTLDGGYFGRRVGSNATIGLFAGSTPDPTSWSYAPDQQMSGIFVNFEGGSFDSTRYTSTSGAGIQMLKWQINRPFVFFENGLYYKRYLSLYSAVQADRPASNPAVPSPGAGISRSFTTLRIQPIDRFEFDVNHTYFRDVPQFDPQLIGTGLLDKYLFQGFSAGPRVEVFKQTWVYATLGKSNRSGDAKSSLNQLYGITFGQLPWKFHADLRYSRFNSSFGDGSYEAVSLSRNFHDNFRWELLAGQQSYTSTLAAANKSHFFNANIEAPIGPHYFLQGGWTWNRGGIMNYDQFFMTFGYRFDSWHRGAK